MRSLCRLRRHASDPFLTAIVTLLGGESTGKSSLAEALGQQLRAQGVRCKVVPEQLREWCRTHGRAPEVHEQAGRALAQTQAIEAAACEPDTDLVIADTTELVVAVYSALYFLDDTLLAPARAQQSRYSLTLLMGLDLPWVPDGLFRDSPAVRQATDALLRRELARAGVRFDTVYGRGPVRCSQAMRALDRALGRHSGKLSQADAARISWRCEACSDPDCEHRLFKRLLGSSALPKEPTIEGQ